MCNFKSGIILKNKTILAPEGNESHSSLLKSIGIEDNYMNAMKKFVRAELIPENGNKMVDVSEWKYKVDQDIVPDWYKEDPGRYEQEFRDAVKEYMKEWKKKFEFVCDYYWESVTEGNLTYHFMNGILGKSKFGKTNNYADSHIRNYLINSELATKLKEKFGDKLVPISLDLTSLDGFKDYGKVEGDVLSIPTLEILMKFGEKIQLIYDEYYLATPNQTPSRGDSSCVRIVDSGGLVSCVDCGWSFGVRPFFITKS